MARPHIVLLGAGASKAAKEEMPLMNELIEYLDLAKSIKDNNLELELENCKGNFELFFSKIYKGNKEHPIIQEVEEKIRKKFLKLKLSKNKATIYDYLVLSLKRKDLIATFNWDPLIWEAVERSKKIFPNDTPEIVFLHGCVSIYYCDVCKIKKKYNTLCNCGEKIKANSKLIFPTEFKDYTTDKYTKNEWDIFEKYLQEGYILTIFGYSGPQNDRKALDLIGRNWNSFIKEYKEIEFIDIKNKDKVFKNWNYNEIIFESHYKIEKSFFDSYLFRHSRSSCEARFISDFDCKFPARDICRFPKENLSLNDLHNWYKYEFKNK